MEKARAKLEAAKARKFRELARHAQALSPYYANLIRERRINLETCTPADFPLLTKSLLMANFNDIVTDRRATKQVVADFLSRSKDPKDKLFDRLTVIHLRNIAKSATFCTRRQITGGCGGPPCATAKCFAPYFLNSDCACGGCA